MTRWVPAIGIAGLARWFVSGMQAFADAANQDECEGFSVWHTRPQLRRRGPR